MTTTHDETEPVVPAVVSEPTKSLLGRARHRFAVYRKTRPFWGGLTCMLGGFFIAKPLLGASWGFYSALGVAGFTPMILGGAIIVAGLVSVITPAQRHFPSVVAIMLAVASLPLANLGGWVIGMLLAIVGAGFCFAWTPYTDKQLAKFADREARRTARREIARATRHAGKHSGAAAA